ncbi:hypothetical protein [Fibrivirga algicola]|uniref:Uncharacterized protein n=1 Tax=Fibrivirga algicola TaxID=2950420 RepID=A0ABX0QF42_9BACT|nr:hypothetical protein [Fibrivirga algicola]NID10632.1 hypothetical protein [Fibrivirga algicola]
MSTGILPNILDKFEEYVTPLGEYIFPPYYSPRPVWQAGLEDREEKWMLDTAKELAKFGHAHGIVSLPDPILLNNKSLRKITIDDHEAFLTAVKLYRQSTSA